MGASKSTFSRIIGHGLWISIVIGGILFIASYLATIQQFYSQATYYNWHSLGKPPEEAIRIVGVTDKTVVVETALGKRLACSIDHESKCWQEIHYQTSLHSERCADVQAENALQVEEACYMLHTSGTRSTIYSLNKDGNIYVIERWIISREGLVLLILLAMPQAIVGFTVSGLFFFLISRFPALKNP